jgi:subfamily B ATP-binding cassette protein MsbA
LDLRICSTEICLLKSKPPRIKFPEQGQDLNGYLIELVHYFKYLKSTAYLSRFSLKLKNIINETYGIESRLGRHTAIIISIKEPFAVFIVVAVMFVQINVMGSSIGSILLSLLLFYRGLGNLMTLQTDWQNFLRLSGAFRMVSEISEKMEEFREPSGSVPFTSIQDEILLKNIHLSFGNSNVLKNVSIRIPKNTTIALTGVSGAGKTTLINIISGLLKPDKGSVYIDQTALTDYDLESYRNKIGYISQESVVFNDSVYNNITFWAEPTEENKQRFWEVVEMSSLTEFLEAQDEQRADATRR